MAIKCAICNKKIEKIYLDKIDGTYVGSGKNKKAVCRECQRKHQDKLKEMV